MQDYLQIPSSIINFYVRATFHIILLKKKKEEKKQKLTIHPKYPLIVTEENETPCTTRRCAKPRIGETRFLAHVRFLHVHVCPAEVMAISPQLCTSMAQRGPQSPVLGEPRCVHTPACARVLVGTCARIERCTKAGAVNLSGGA